MGATCCVAAKDKTISSGSHAKKLQRHARFRWDNRVREAEEETSGGSSSSDRSCKRMRSKLNANSMEAEFGSEKGSPLLDSSQKSTASESTEGVRRIPSYGRASPQNTKDVKESTGPSSSISCPSPLKLSPAVSSLSTSPLSSSSQSQLIHPPNSDNKSLHTTLSLSEVNSLLITPSSSNESTRSFDTGSIPGFSDLTRSSGHNSRRSLSFDLLHSCGICSKLLSERPPWGGMNKLVSIYNGLSVVSVLTCGHVYHAECLEHMTPDINKYDPSCPVCAFGEKMIAKMSETALKAKLEMKARKKKSKNCVVDSDFSDVSSELNKSGGGLEEKGSKLGSSSMEKPFLRPHFSVSGNKPSSENHRRSSVRKGFFWARSSKY